MAKKSLSDLPEGMITEVLLRLPMKSLLMCKSVCKPWLSAISNPHFVKSQLHRAITTSRNDPTLLTIINIAKLEFFTHLPAAIAPPPTTAHSQLQQRRRQLLNQALQDADAQDLSRLHLQFARFDIPKHFSRLARFVSCCNGIICVSSFEAVYFWNPSITKFRKLSFQTVHPKEPSLQFLELFFSQRDLSVAVGFGYDNVSNEYKLLRFVYNNREDIVPLVKVYYVNADCCREIQGPILKTQISEGLSNIAVDGVLYFDGGDQLVSFDLHDEVFGLVPFPDSIQREMSDIMDFEGSVAMVFESGSGVDLWTLNNVSGELSWTKKFSIEYGLDDLDTEIWLSCYLGAKQFYGRKLLNANGNHFLYEILYDYEKKETKYCGLQEEYVNMYSTTEQEMAVGVLLNDSVHAALRYTQTLVSLNGFEQVKLP